MPSLILLNGPPASGKSTVAARFIESRPLALDLDVDLVRGMLGCWIDTPNPAGHAARSLATAMARVHLSNGHDVIVPQFLGRPDFIVELELVADETDATFVETALLLSREDALEAFAQRSRRPENRNHADAAALVESTSAADPVGAMYDAFLSTVGQRPATRRIDVIRGNIGATMLNFERALSKPG